MPGYLSPVSLHGLVEGTLATMFEVTAIVNWIGVCWWEQFVTQPQLHAAFPQTHARLGINSLPAAGKEPQASGVTCSFNFRKCLKCRLIRKTFKFFILNTKYVFIDICESCYKENYYELHIHVGCISNALLQIVW